MGGRFSSKELALKAVGNAGLAAGETVIFKDFREELVLNKEVSANPRQ